MTSEVQTPGRPVGEFGPASSAELRESVAVHGGRTVPIQAAIHRRKFIVSTQDKVFGIVSEQLGVPQEEVTLEASFVDDLKADSLDVVELVMEFEDEFGITIPDDDYEKIKTVGDAINYIEEKS